MRLNQWRTDRRQAKCFCLLDDAMVAIDRRKNMDQIKVDKLVNVWVDQGSIDAAAFERRNGFGDLNLKSTLRLKKHGV